MKTYKCPKNCGGNLTKVIHNGILYGFYCLDCDKDYLPAGYTKPNEEQEKEQ